MSTTMTTTDRRPAETGVVADTDRLPVLDLAGIGAIAAVAVIHTSELSGKIEETGYLGFGYLLLVVASVMAIVMIARHDVRGWILGGLAAAATIVGFVLTRTTGLPHANGDIGNWSETIATWSLIAEVGVVALALVALRRHRDSSAR